MSAQSIEHFGRAIFAGAIEKTRSPTFPAMNLILSVPGMSVKEIGLRTLATGGNRRWLSNIRAIATVARLSVPSGCERHSEC